MLKKDGPPSQPDPEERKRKIAALKVSEGGEWQCITSCWCCQAQADQQADAMRRKLEEKRQQREAASQAAGVPAVRGRGEEGGEGKVEVRKQWGDPKLKGAPILARQCDATGVVRDGKCIRGEHI